MRRGGRRPTAGRLALFLVGGVLIVLALAQLLLPRIAASVISSRIGRYGKVQSVSVNVWPAVRLLWGSAGSVHVKATSLTMEPEQASKLLWESRGTSSMDISVEHMNVGSLQVTDANLRKRGDALSGQASATEAAVKAALPEGFAVRLLRSERGQVEVQASGGLFGIGASVNAVGMASEGKLIAHPSGFLIGGIRLTLFSDPHVYVEGVGASIQVQQPLTYRLTMSARLR
jgi:hypothetical protein